MNIDDLKELYYREMERKDRLTTMPSVSILVLTILFGACNYYVQHFKFELSPSYFVFLGILALAFICFGLAIHALIRAYIGYNYNALPYASDLHAYYQDLLEYNRYYKIPDSEAQNSY
ncbi:MAG: hypothetical protein GXY34_15395, partial [Syntrophomonadaceae bacterium]|nr:hypothetical protein [Syntrophomonadaceae bacterium]